MKKKISLLICMLVAMLTFSGCASDKTELEYDEASIEQVTDFLVNYCTSLDEATLDQWNSMSEFALEQQLNEAGLPFTPESFLGALDSWQAGIKECGAYISHDSYTYEASKNELKVTAEAEYQDRDATLEFVFDQNLYLDSMTVSAHFSTGEILEKAGMNTLLGMGTVFAVLIFISLIISLFRFIPAIQSAFTRKPKADDQAVVLTKAETVPAAAPAPSTTDDGALVAVISAAVAAAEGTTTDGFVVRSIKRRKSNKWN